MSQLSKFHFYLIREVSFDFILGVCLKAPH